MFMRSSKVLAAASVALVVLIDLATGQGPPVYTNYMQAQQDFRPPPPPMQPIGYRQQGAYPLGPEMDREYKKSGKEELKDEKKFEKELKKDEKYDKYDKQGYENTPAPGVLSSFSNSMNDAWKSISSLGRRSKRGAGEENKTTSSTSSKENTAARSINGKQDASAPSAAPAERAMDSYEFLQYKNQGYVYFKVPKYLVCNS